VPRVRVARLAREGGPRGRLHARPVAGLGERVHERPVWPDVVALHDRGALEEGRGFGEPALAALAVGMMCGETLTAAVAEKVEPGWLAAGLAAMGCLFFAFAWSGSVIVALPLLAAFGVANGFTEVVMMTAIHQEAEATHQGRVFGVGSTIWRTTMLGAVALAPAIDAVASPAQAITVAAGFLFVGAIFVQVTLRQSPRSATATA